MSAADLGATLATLYVGHVVGDHVVQNDRDACAKGLPGREGQQACLRHVTSYTATAVIALAATAAATGMRSRPGRVLAGLAVSAVSHYIIDRREPLRRLAQATGNARFFALGAPRPGRDDNPCLGTGAYALDQSAHCAFLFAASLIIAGGKR